MGQDNRDGNDTRDCWKSNREKERRKARYTIRERVATSVAADGDQRDYAHQQLVEVQVSTAHKNELDCSDEWDKILPKIHATHRSAFSVTFFASNFDLLSHLVPASYLRSRLPEQLILSFFGHGYYDQLQQYLQSMVSLSLLEYTSLLGRYVILSAFLSGGINPCIRGGSLTANDTCTNNQALLDIGTRISQRFFQCFPPPLATYIVKRCVDMRMEAVLQQQQSSSSSATCHDNTFECNICHQDCPANQKLTFGAGAATVSCGTTSYKFCHHSFCEPCFWEDLLQHVDTRLEGNVVLCPCCGLASPDFFVDEKDGRFKLVEKTSFSLENVPQSEEKRETTQQRYQQSKARYEALPVDIVALKKSDGKKNKVSKSQFMCTTWSQAVKPSLGLCQSVRREKFLTHTESGSFPYVRGCLEAGVDANLQNEYGQTALYLSCWRGNSALVKLLLKYGADPTIRANGEVSVDDVCRANGCWQVLEVLQQHGYSASEKETGANKSVIPRHSLPFETPHVECLIAPNQDHPGAGSYTVSSIIPFVDPLMDLWRRLPVEQISVKKKKGMCSDRSYYCDTEGDVSSFLAERLIEAFEHHLKNKEVRIVEDVAVFPHMRFLHYGQPGLSLAPHVDLCRVDSSGRRSTHSFLWYLTDNDHGGETVLLGGLSGEGLDIIMASVKPRRGLLLLFPHNCPHLGAEVRDVPKLLIRGEVLLNLKS